MKPLNNKFKDGFKRYMRCINKDDLSYVDVGLPSGSNSYIRNELLKYAEFMSGNEFVISNNKKYHYYFMFSIDENKNPLYELNGEQFNKGQELDKLDEYIIVDIETLKIKEIYKYITYSTL